MAERCLLFEAVDANTLCEEWTKNHVELPKAEHGFSMLVRIFYEGKQTASYLTQAAVQRGLLVTLNA